MYTSSAEYLEVDLAYHTVFAFASLQNKYNNLNAKIALMKLIFIYNASAKTRKYFWITQSLRNIFWFQMLIRLLHVQNTESKSHKSKCIRILRRSSKYV